MISFLGCTDINDQYNSYSKDTAMTQLVSNLWNIVQLQNHEISLKSKSSIENIQGMCALLFVVIIVLLIILTPVVLVYNWAINFYDYVRNYKNKRLTALESEKALNIWKDYKRIYSDMSGFGYGLLAYNISAFGYMYFYFDKISEGFLFYINFPFKVYNNLSQAMNPNTAILGADVWIQMLVIIGIALLAFILGKIFGFYVVNKRFEKPVMKTSQQG